MGVGAGAGEGGGAFIVVVAVALLFDINICERAAYPPVAAVLVGAVAVEDGPKFWY